MWIWDQSAGKMYHQNGDDEPVFKYDGYSGKDWAKNNPDADNISGMGPIPKGMWRIGGAHNSARTGPNTIILYPDAKTRTYGRSAFRIHGDSIKLPGTASHGCIILAKPCRLEMIGSTDKVLAVVS